MSADEPAPDGAFCRARIERALAAVQHPLVPAPVRRRVQEPLREALAELDPTLARCAQCDTLAARPRIETTTCPHES